MATIVSSVNGSNTTFTIQLASSDPQNWEVIINSKQQDGRMASGFSDYPWFVEFFYGTGSQTVIRSYIPGDYIAELDVGGKPVDYSAFSVAAPAPQTYPFVLMANFSGVPSGTGVTFSGTYKPSTTVNIFIEGLVRQHLAQVTTDAQGNFSATVPLTNTGTATTTYQIGACEASTVPGGLVECALLSPISNYVYVAVGPTPTPAPVPPPPPPPPPTVQPNHALIINLSALSWADLNGLAQYLPAIAKAFADAITLYGILGITITKTAIESGNLVIYYNQASTGTTGIMGITAESDKYVFMPYYTPYRQLKALPQHSAFGFMGERGAAVMTPGGAYSPGWAVPEHAEVGFMEEYPYCTPYCLPEDAKGFMGLQTMQLPQEVAIPAAIITIAGIALRFGFLIVGWSVVNLATKYVEVQKTQADITQTTTTTIADMCKSGQLTPTQCAEALAQKPKEECWISNPLGGCVLSASTGKAIVGTVVVVTLAGIAYWLATRHPEEVRKIVSGAKQAVTGEVERARAAFRG